MPISSIPQQSSPAFNDEHIDHYEADAMVEEQKNFRIVNKKIDALIQKDEANYLKIT